MMLTHIAPDPSVAPIAAGGTMSCRNRQPEMDERLARAVLEIRQHCQPLLDFLGMDSTAPAGDVLEILRDCLVLAEAEEAGSVGSWSLQFGRVTTVTSRKALYKRGVWLQSDTGLIIDTNRPDLETGLRITMTDSREIAEYRPGGAKVRLTISPLLPIWRGDSEGFAGFATQKALRKTFGLLRVRIAALLRGDL